jgi:hypothetical protein
MKTTEQIRLEEARDQKVPWKKWGPYLSERQWLSSNSTASSHLRLT